MALSGLTWGDADRQVVQAINQEPERFLAFLRGFEIERDHMTEYVKNRLSSGHYCGIGELFINGHGRTIAGDSPGLMELYRLAAEFQVPVLIHWTIGSLSEKEPGTKPSYQQLKKALGTNPKTLFILAHCGKGPPPLRQNFEDILDYLLKQYKNLHLDISGLQDDLFADDGTTTTFGKLLMRLIEKYPHQFMLGFDLGEPGALFSEASATIKLFRKFLSLLPIEVARKIAGENAQRVLCPGRLMNLEKKQPHLSPTPMLHPAP